VVLHLAEFALQHMLNISQLAQVSLLKRLHLLPEHLHLHEFALLLPGDVLSEECLNSAHGLQLLVLRVLHVFACCLQLLLQLCYLGA